MRSIWCSDTYVFYFCARGCCLSPSQSVSFVCLYLSLSRCPFLVKSRPETNYGTSASSCCFWIASCGSDLPGRQQRRKHQTGNCRARACVSVRRRRNCPFGGEMSSVSAELVPIGEPIQAGAEEAESQQAAGILQPQTVFVILDSAETLNLVQWVR